MGFTKPYNMSATSLWVKRSFPIKCKTCEKGPSFAVLKISLTSVGLRIPGPQHYTARNGERDLSRNADREGKGKSKKI